MSRRSKHPRRLRHRLVWVLAALAAFVVFSIVYSNQHQAAAAPTFNTPYAAFIGHRLDNELFSTFRNSFTGEPALRTVAVIDERNLTVHYVRSSSVRIDILGRLLSLLDNSSVTAHDYDSVVLIYEASFGSLSNRTITKSETTIPMEQWVKVLRSSDYKTYTESLEFTQLWANLTLVNGRQQHWCESITDGLPPECYAILERIHAQ